jgi:hypothetical protein
LVFTWLIKRTPRFLKAWFRKLKLNNLRFVSSKRWCVASIQSEIAKAQSRFIVFIICIFTFIGWLAYEPIQQLLEAGLLVGLIFSSPIYIFQIAWMRQDSKVDSLLFHRRKLRIKVKLAKA